MQIHIEMIYSSFQSYRSKILFNNILINFLYINQLEGKKKYPKLSSWLNSTVRGGGGGMIIQRT